MRPFLLCTLGGLLGTLAIGCLSGTDYITGPRSEPAAASGGPAPSSGLPITAPGTVALATAPVDKGSEDAPPPPRPAKAHHDRPKVGTLTAGSFDDNLYPEPLLKFLKKIGRDQEGAALSGKLSGHRLTVVARARDGGPVGNARVRLAEGTLGHAPELVTRSDGRAVFISSWDGFGDADLTVTVTPPDGSASVRQSVSAGTARCDVALPLIAAPLPKNLDLVMVLDTTGSMGDELEYLKAEVKGIASAVRKRFPLVSQRYGLVCYRDDGDEYVTRTFPFTASIEEFRKQLAGQRADGGGDEPEAMHRGLEEAVALPWRSADTARVVFLIADAPPHTEHFVRTMKAVDGLRKKGVAIYPVACSGYNARCELVMRTCALLTGAEFVFLTDDSGVGDKHAEPHIPFYNVEHLNRLMARLIAGELAGRRLDPSPEDILRTVGHQRQQAVRATLAAPAR